MKESFKKAPNQESFDDVKDSYVQDPNKAEVMAYAEKRNTENKMAFKAIAAAHIMRPDLSQSPLSARIKVAEGEEFSSTDPSRRIVKAVDTGGYTYGYTAESAMEEAKKERDAADAAGELAGEQYDEENGAVAQRVQNPEEAYYMAHAADLNQTNALEFEKLAKYQEDFAEYNLQSGVDIHPTQKTSSRDYSRSNPQTRVVSQRGASDHREVRTWTYTSEQAMEEAQKERIAADEAAEKAREQYKKLNEI